MISPLHAILDVETASSRGWDPLDLARAFLDGGARVIQIRAKRLASGPLLQVCDRLVQAAAARQAAVIVNDRADLTAMAGAAGVHVGQDDLAPLAARDLLGPGAVVGVSTHTAEQVEAAVMEPVSYVAVGPVFGTRTKATGYEAVGLDLVRQAVRRAHGLPIVAIGGITIERAPAVIEAGATAVAVISDLLTGNDPAARVRAFLDALS